MKAVASVARQVSPFFDEKRAKVCSTLAAIEFKALFLWVGSPLAIHSG